MVTDARSILFSDHPDKLSILQMQQTQCDNGFPSQDLEFTNCERGFSLCTAEVKQLLLLQIIRVRLLHTARGARDNSQATENLAEL